MWVIVELNRNGDIVEVHSVVFTDIESAEDELKFLETEYDGIRFFKLAEIKFI